MKSIIGKAIIGALLFIAGVASTMFNSDSKPHNENRSRIRLVSISDEIDANIHSSSVQIDAPKSESSQKPSLGNYLPKKPEVKEQPPIDQEIDDIRKRVEKLESICSSRTSSTGTSASYQSGNGSTGGGSVGGGSTGSVSYSSYQTSPTDCNVYSYQAPQYQSSQQKVYTPVRSALKAITPPQRLWSTSDRCYVDANCNRVCP